MWQPSQPLPQLDCAPNSPFCSISGKQGHPVFCTFASSGSKEFFYLQGVIVYFRVVDGEMRVGDTIRLINTAKEYQIGELGVLAPKPVQVSFLTSARES